MHEQSLNSSEKNVLVTELRNNYFLFLNLSRTDTYGHWYELGLYFGDVAMRVHFLTVLKGRRGATKGCRGVFAK